MEGGLVSITSKNKLAPVFDTRYFPIVYVHFNTHIDQESFQYFLDSWMECYKRKRDFTFVFNLEKVVWFNPSYCYRLAKFMKTLKTQPELSYLKTSIVVLNNNIIRKMIRLLFSIQPPQSHVYLTPDMIHANGIIRGNKEFIKNCDSVLPDTKITLTQSQREDLEKTLHNESGKFKE